MTQATSRVRTAMGTIERDTVWSGDVQVTGDVVVAAGATLKVLAGTRVHFAERPRWSCSVFRRSPESQVMEVSMRDACDVVVLGRLAVAGSREAPVRLGAGGAAWGGITCLERGAVDLQHATIENAPHFCVQALDDARVQATDSDCAGAQYAVWAWGTSEVSWQGGTLAAARASVICCEGGRVTLAEVGDASPEGIAALDWGLIRAARMRFAAPRKHCAVARHRAWIQLDGCGSLAAESAIVQLDDALVQVDR